MRIVSGRLFFSSMFWRCGCFKTQYVSSTYCVPMGAKKVASKTARVYGIASLSLEWTHPSPARDLCMSGEGEKCNAIHGWVHLGSALLWQKKEQAMINITISSAADAAADAAATWYDTHSIRGSRREDAREMIQKTVSQIQPWLVITHVLVAVRV